MHPAGAENVLLHPTSCSATVHASLQGGLPIHGTLPASSSYQAATYHKEAPVTACCTWSLIYALL